LGLELVVGFEKHFGGNPQIPAKEKPMSRDTTGRKDSRA
jgi:hypothetical protein